MTKGREGRRVWVSTNTEPVERDLEYGIQVGNLGDLIRSTLFIW